MKINMMPDANTLFFSFFVTIGMEACLIVALLYREVTPKYLLLVSLVVLHMVTHPVGAIFYYLLHTPILLVELGIVLAEGVFYRSVLQVSWRLALLASLFANTASYILGPYIRSLMIT